MTKPPARRAPPTDPMLGLADRVLQALEESPFPNAEVFCEAAGISRSTFSRFAAGKQRSVHLSVLVRIAETLGVTTDWLLVGRDPKRPGGAISGNRPVPLVFQAGQKPTLESVRAALDQIIEAGAVPQYSGNERRGPDDDGH